MNVNHDVEEIVAEYADKIFGFCINRLNNIDDAQDLAQDILLEIVRCLPKSDVSNINAWIWKIARNRYAKRFSGKKRIIVVSLDDMSIIDTLADDRDFFEKIDEDNNSEISAVFSAVHSLAKSHRDILIDYYVNELSYSEMADKHKLSVNTVKTRLFYGKQKLKERWQSIMNENRVYEKINWLVGCNGSIDANKYLGSQIRRAITKAAYEKALTPSEISAVTGIPCMYIEDEIPQLLNGEALTEDNGKYATNFIIQDLGLVKAAEALIHKSVSNVEFADRLIKILDKHDARIRDIGFIGNDRPKGELWRLLVPQVIREATGKVRSLSEIECPPYPHRNDGGFGWFWIKEVENEQNLIGEYDAGCNIFRGEKNEVRYYWNGKYFSMDINEYFRQNDSDKSFVDKIFESDSIDIDKKSMDEMALAQGIKCNLIEKTTDGGYKWTLMFFTEEQFKKLEAIIAEIANEISDLTENLSKAMIKIYDLYKQVVPKRLHDQIKGVIGGINNGSESICAICEILEQNGTFTKPDSEYLTKQILVIRK